MTNDAIDLDLGQTPVLPEPRDQPIGMIGAGFIVADVQLPAYRDAGFRVMAIASRTRSRAESVAARHGIRRVYGSWEELLDDPGLQALLARLH